MQSCLFKFYRFKKYLTKFHISESTQSPQNDIETDMFRQIAVVEHHHKRSLNDCLQPNFNAVHLELIKSSSSRLTLVLNSIQHYILSNQNLLNPNK